MIRDGEVVLSMVCWVLGCTSGDGRCMVTCVDPARWSGRLPLAYSGLE